MKKIEQVSTTNKIIIDYDRTLTKKQIIDNYKQLFDNIIIEDKQVIINNNVALLTMNVTYLGHPHPIFKKRIQMPSYFIEKHNGNKKKGLNTFFVGIYSYNKSYLYCIFKPISYLNNKFNNSSAHVYSFDLLEAQKKGHFRKIDKNKNEILIYNEDKFVNFIRKNSLLKDYDLDFEKEDELIRYLDSFWEQLPDKFYGIDCYNEMLMAEYSNALQAEWFGFYFEYLFSKYLIENSTEIINFYADKKKDGIDLDLKVNIYDNYYADLKSHTKNAGIIGNDLNTVKKVVDKGGTILYISVEYASELDKNFSGTVTKFWNQKINIRYNKNKSLDSYLNRMKNNVILYSFSILRINKETFKYTDIYEQGINSNGKERDKKLHIKKKNIPILTIYSRKRNDK